MPRPAPRLPKPRAMLVAPQPEAVEAGTATLAAGGNAIDAVLATALMQGVVDPLMSGIGGLGVLHLFEPATGRHAVIDGLSTCPAACTPDMWERKFLGECADGYGYRLEGGVNELGHGAVTTPGILRVFEAAYAEFGSMPWAKLFAPAIARARGGWLIRPHVYAMMTMDESRYGRLSYAKKLNLTPDGAALYCQPDGTPKRPGAVVVNTALAASLEAIAAGGPDVFYTGALAQKIVADMQAHGGLLTAADLAAFRVRREAVLEITYRGRRIVLPAPPAGGIVVAEALRVLEGFDLVAMGHNSPAYIATLAEAMKRALVDKERHIGDPDFAPAPVDRLLSDAHAQAAAARIRSGEKISMTEGALEPAGTTTISAVDANGMVVSLTHTLGVPSGVIPPGTGFMLNGAMNWYDPRPGRPSSIAPGKRRFSSMTPTLVFEGDTPVMTLGAPGGAWIGVAILQVLVNVLDFGMSMQQAVMAPRFSATTDVIDLSNRIPYATEAAVQALGYETRRNFHSFPFAAPHGITLWDGVLEGGADPQRDGYVGVVS
jgi:gamma-glutamyltranspeptidase / glutathione hydrolase